MPRKASAVCTRGWRDVFGVPDTYARQVEFLAKNSSFTLLEDEEPAEKEPDEKSAKKLAKLERKVAPRCSSRVRS